jgi:Outer membrane lipoprotein-sorting protein
MKFRHLLRLISKVVFGLIFSLSPACALSAGDDTARVLLSKALENQYRGHFQSSLIMVNEVFPNGRDSLLGQAEFVDEMGERRISLVGRNQAFAYHSLHFGNEQWLTDDYTHRIRRIANRQWKKGPFGTLFSYEDMLKFPNDFFLEYSSCKGIVVTDSTYQIEMMVKPFFQSFYSKLDVTLGKNPVLLKKITFYGQQQQQLKTMDVKAYQQVAGKWLISDLMLSSSDSLSRLEMSFRQFTFPSAPLVQNGVGKAGSSMFLSRLMPKGLARGSEEGLEKPNLENEIIEDISN